MPASGFSLKTRRYSLRLTYISLDTETDAELTVRGLWSALVRWVAGGSSCINCPGVSNACTGRQVLRISRQPPCNCLLLRQEDCKAEQIRRAAEHHEMQ